MRSPPNLRPSYSVGTVSLASLVVGIRDILAYKKREVRFVKALCTDVDVGTHTITIQGSIH